MTTSLLAGFLTILFTPHPLHAEQEQRISYATGTGFYVSRQGHVVTNAHVVPACVSVHVRTSRGGQFEGVIVGLDEARDLALIKTRSKPKRIARMRHRYTRIYQAEKVMVMGYPSDRENPDLYEINLSSVKDLIGPSGETGWLQFEDAARPGNSGGPLMDFAGNVVGVVKGKNTRSRLSQWTGKEEIIDTSDVAINLNVLKDFLHKHRILFESRDSLMKVSERELERVGKEFIVNVLCRLPG